MPRSAYIALLLPLSVFFVLCASCTRRPAQAGVLVVHTIAEPEDLHPANGASALRTDINLYIHASLVKLDYETGQLVPCLAQSLPRVSPDGLSYTYTLKKGITWDDCTPITGHDVAFTAKANKCLLTNNPGLKPYWSNLDSVAVDQADPARFTVRMKRPYILNTWFWMDFPIIEQAFYDKPNTLSHYGFRQLSDSAFTAQHADLKAWADEFNHGKYYSNPAFISGAGPYKISTWDKGASLTLERKKDHWSSRYADAWFFKAGPEKIIYKVNNNNASTALEFRNGLVDVSTMIDLASFKELKRDAAFNERYTAELSNTYNYTYVALNMRPDGVRHKKLFNDVNVRKAVAMLTPYEQINKVLYDNQNQRVAGPVAPSKHDVNTGLKPVAYNPAQAKALLAKSGWADSDGDQVLDKIIDGQKIKFECKINYLSTQKQWEDLAKQLAESMRQAGIVLELHPVDYEAFVTAATSHDFDLSIGAWQNTAQPEDFSQLWASTSWSNNGLNFPGFGNAASDALIDSINASVTDAKRMALSKRFQQLVYNEQPYIFLFTQTRRVVVSKKWDHLKIYEEYPGVLLNTLTLKE